MRIGVVSDTHDNLPNVARIVEILNAAGVARVVHTGDITQPKTIHALAALEAPLHGVFGNNDVLRGDLLAAAETYGFALAEPPLRLVWARREIVVVHDPRELGGLALADGQLALHGHDHRHREERRGGALVFNPGECAGWLAGHNAVGIVDLDSLEIERPRF